MSTPLAWSGWGTRAATPQLRVTTPNGDPTWGSASACTAAQARSAHDRHVSCDIGSAYVIDTYRRAFLFNQPGRQPAEIGVGGGRLFIEN